MRVTMILPALTEATSPLFRPIKYSLFPPLGLATLAAYLNDDDEVRILDEHVEPIDAYVADDRPDIVVIQVYITSTERTLAGLPPVRRDLIRRERYLVPNSIVVSRGCPHHCDFCYKDAFFAGGKSFYTQLVDDALAEIDRLPGRHLYFLDDHLLGNRRFAEALFAGMAGMNRVWQAASTVDALLAPGLLEKAVGAGMRSVFVGFETINADNLAAQRKRQNINRSYAEVARRVHAAGAMINASFVFGMDGDTPDVFDRTVDWAVTAGLETATFHIMTPYPGTALFRRMEAAGRMVHRDWDRYDTRQVVFRPAGMTATELEQGYRHAYRSFYRWPAIWRGARDKPAGGRLRHLAYAGGWKKFEPLWDALIRSRQVLRALPLLETALGLGAGRRRPAADPVGVAGERATERDSNLSP